MTLDNICVCICTYKRPQLLERLLQELSSQVTAQKFTYSIVVVDNDRLESAKPVAEQFKAKSPIPLSYVVEAQQNIALARNKAIESATGNYVAFIDDDEFPTANWLLLLFETCQQYQVDGALGPVKPYFETPAPEWVVKGRFYDRPTYPTGYVIDWRKGRTGNVLLKKSLFRAGETAFRPDFHTGEDQDFFRRMIDQGHVFVWCNEAVAYEIVPPIRWKRSFMLRRALLRGRISMLHPTSRPIAILKSAVAIPLYALALPFLLLLGQHKFMQYLIKSCDHAGRLLACVGIQAVKETYVTE